MNSLKNSLYLSEIHISEDTFNYTPLDATDEASRSLQSSALQFPTLKIPTALTINAIKPTRVGHDLATE